MISVKKIVLFSLIASCGIASADQLVIGTNAGAYLSNDSGQSWTIVPFSSNGSSESVKVAYIDNTEMLIGAQYDGLYLSKDGGTTWAKLINYPSLGAANYFYSLFKNQGTFFVGTMAGLYTSNDNGQTWNLSLNDQINGYAINGNSIFLNTTGASGTAFYLSTNNGQSWSVVNIPNSQSMKFTGFSAAGSSIIVSSAYPAGIFISNDFGNTWHPSYIPNDNIMDVYTNGKDFYAEGSRNNYISLDDGQTWSVITDIASLQQPQMVFSNDSVTALASAGAYYSSNDGLAGSWASLANEIPISLFNTSIIGSQNYVVYSGRTVQGINQAFLSSNQGADWNQINYPAGQNALVYAIAINKSGN